MERNNDKKVKNMDSELWHACAGPLVRLPPVNSTVCYFPQGHADHVDFPAAISAIAAVPNLIRCRVAAINLSADGKAEVFATMRLVPIPDDAKLDGDGGGGDGDEEQGIRSTWCSKVLTQSDANNGGGFSVPKLCAGQIFPPLDYNDDPPVQEIMPADVHGKEWSFRHIFRGTPRRHLLTSGWSKFVNGKNLVAGDSIIFLKGEGGIRVGVRRGARWLPEGSVRARAAKAVMEAVALAVEGKPFEVTYYPCWRGGATEFVVREELVVEAAVATLLTKTLRPGARAYMEVEDHADPCAKKSCFGTVTQLQAFDPLRWPTSPWKMVKVIWDKEEDQIKQMSQVNAWSISVESSAMPFSSGSDHMDVAYLNNDDQISAENGGVTSSEEGTQEARQHDDDDVTVDDDHHHFVTASQSNSKSNWLNLNPSTISRMELAWDNKEVQSKQKSQVNLSVSIESKETSLSATALAIGLDIEQRSAENGGPAAAERNSTGIQEARRVGDDVGAVVAVPPQPNMDNDIVNNSDDDQLVVVAMELKEEKPPRTDIKLFGKVLKVAPVVPVSVVVVEIENAGVASEAKRANENNDGAGASNGNGRDTSNALLASNPMRRTTEVLRTSKSHSKFKNSGKGKQRN